ncbi:MAG: hypothetical protein RIC14_15335 [Filomicrobium sp.]
MSKKTVLGLQSIFLGWLVAMGIGLVFFSSAGAGLGIGTIIAVALAAFTAFRWVTLTKAEMAGAGEAGGGIARNAIDHSLALVAAGAILGLPLTALGLYLFPSLTEALGLGGEGAVTVSIALLGLLLSWLLAGGWSYNCAPDWIDPAE